MLNLLTKTKPWMVASLLVATTVFGQDNAPCPKPCAPSCAPACPKPCPPKPCATPCPKPECAPKCCPTPCPQPCPPTQLCPPPCPNPCCPPWPVPVLNAAYNYPARTIVRCPWDIFFDVSFIYWQPLQENMELGVVNTTAPSSLGSFTTTAAGIDGTVVDMDFDYKPGFKIGFGGNLDWDNWDVHGEYTWFHNRQSVSTGVPSPGQLFPFWGVPSGTNNFYDSGKEKWRLNMDIVDLDMGRSYYVGTKLIFRTGFGARAAWIRQDIKATYTALGDLGILGNTADVTTVHGRSHSWAVGPEISIDTNWMVGWGFRIFGNGEADLLYTRYTRLSFNEDHTAAVAGGFAPFHIKQKRYGSIRTHLCLDMGIGWGTYWDCNNWYTDVALGYEFQTFFDQNMFRHFVDDVMIMKSNVPNGNLYIHGLTATFRLDF